MKAEIGARNCLYPMPTTLVGALVEGKPNFITIAHVGIMDPASVSLGMNKNHFTNAGIKANGTFSVNIPSVKMVEETDYCGLVSGARALKTTRPNYETASPNIATQTHQSSPKSSIRFAHLIKICGMLLQTKVYLYWSNSKT